MKGRGIFLIFVRCNRRAQFEKSERLFERKNAGRNLVRNADKITENPQGFEGILSLLFTRDSLDSLARSSKLQHFIDIFLRRGWLVCYNEEKEWKARDARESSICLSRKHLSFADGRSCI